MFFLPPVSNSQFIPANAGWRVAWCVILMGMNTQPIQDRILLHHLGIAESHLENTHGLREHWNQWSPDEKALWRKSMEREFRGVLKVIFALDLEPRLQSIDRAAPGSNVPPPSPGAAPAAA